MSELSSLNSPVGNGAMQAHQNYTDIHALNNLKQQAREDQRSVLRPVAEQFEALFVEQIFKEARKVKLDDGWLDGNQGDFFKDWHDKQLAQNLAAKGSLGFADTIVEQLLPSIPNIKKVGNDNTQQNSTNSVKPLAQENQSQPAPSSTNEALAARPLL